MIACLVTTVHEADDARIFHKQAKTLVTAGYEVVLLAPGKERHKNGKRTRMRPDEGGRVLQDRANEPAGRFRAGMPERSQRVAEAPKTIYLPIPRMRFLRLVAGGTVALFAALRQRAQVFHLHDPELLPIGLVLKAVGKKVIYDVHEDYPEQMLTKHYLPVPVRRAASSLVNLVEKAIASRLDGIVCATETIAGKFWPTRPGLRARSAWVTVVRNYPVFSASLPRQPVMGNGNRFRLIHLSETLTPERGIASMVRALERLDDRFELILGGRFVTAAYENFIRSLAGFRRVRLVGRVPHEQVWDWYRASDAGLVCLLPLPRYQASLPVKLFEFMAAGLPVVVSDFPRFREVVARNRCGFCVDPENPDEIAAAVRWLAQDREMAREMGEHGRQAVAETYNWQQDARRMLELYDRILRSGQSAAQGQSVLGVRRV
ncbi:MAG: glycosyltransferase family 4 protein [candidate division WOR-3 bacterium]